jgi:ankyrin repeat protein
MYQRFNINTLLSACYYGYNKLALKLLDTERDIIQRDGFGNTILFYGCRNKMIDIVNILVKKYSREELNNQNIFGESALHEAVYKNNIILAEILLYHGADINLKDISNLSIFDLACHRNNDDMALILLQYGCKLDGSINKYMNKVKYMIKTKNYLLNHINNIMMNSDAHEIFYEYYINNIIINYAIN